MLLHGVKAEDQVSFRAELEALIKLCDAILAGLRKPDVHCRHVVIAVDNKSAIGIADECYHAELGSCRVAKLPPDGSLMC